MNIFKWITNRAGKVALSAVQAVGLSAVVGVAGIAAWQYLDAPVETNNTFMPAAYDSGEVVYVAGANTGSYAGGSYAGGGESSSSMQISANTLKRLDRQEMAQRAAQEMAEYAPDYSSAAAAPGQAYHMGGTDGLGTGANVANEFDLKNNPMAAMQQSMAGISNMVSQAQAQAQQSQGAAPAKQDGPATLSSASKNWGSSGATGSTSGNSFNSSFSVQDSGKNKGAAGGTAAAQQVGNVLASAQAQAASMMQEGGARLRGRASFGSSGLGGDRDASVQAGRRVNPLQNELEDITHKSAAAAKNRNRSTVEGARAFLASSKVSGGMMITADNVTTGQGQGSKDFETTTDNNLRGLKSWQLGTENTAAQRDKDRHSMQTWFWVAMGVALAAMIAIPIVKNVPIWGKIIALCIAAVATALLAVGIGKAAGFAHKWGGSGYSTMMMIALPILMGGVWAAFFINLSDKINGTIKDLFGIGTGTVKGVSTSTAVMAGGSAAGVGYMGATSGSNPQ